MVDAFVEWLIIYIIPLLAKLFLGLWRQNVVPSDQKRPAVGGRYTRLRTYWQLISVFSHLKEKRIQSATLLLPLVKSLQIFCALPTARYLAAPLARHLGALHQTGAEQIWLERAPDPQRHLFC